MNRKSGFDPITLEIYRALYTSVAEEMGIALRRTSFSPNIKERRDYSCAVFDTEGRVIAQGDHMPVHLGSMPMAVTAALRKITFAPGDTVALNDPFAGGTHLPDVTLIAGVFEEKAESRRQKAEGSKQKAEGSKQRAKSSELKAGSTGRKAADEQGSSFAYSSSSAYCFLPSAFSSPRPLFYVANRAHHADIGGGAPGSMGMAADIYGEGVRIPPLRLISRGKLNEEVFDLLLANVRAADERRADFEAQLGSLKTGEARLREIIERSGAREAAEYAGHLIEYAARIMRRTIAQIPDGVYEAEDWLDDDGVTDDEIRLRVRVTIKGERARVDFSGSHAQVRGPVNAVEAITTAAVTYVFRCLVGADDVPASAGLVQPIEVIAPPGTIVNALHPAPVAGGNVETSQRIVDVLFKALAQALPQRIPAASQGTMNNLTIGGVNPHTQQEFAYYETMAGGMGARPSLDGISAVHTHMTNSLNTPVEALEFAYPLRVWVYHIRRGSGGSPGESGTRGGDGLVREIETLVPARMSLLADRRKRGPYGIRGGADGQPGRNCIVRQGCEMSINSKGTWPLEAGDRVRIETPGGGGGGAESTKR